MGFEIDYKSMPKAQDWNFMINLINGDYCQTSRADGGIFAPPSCPPFVYGCWAAKYYADNQGWQPILDGNGEFLGWGADPAAPLTNYIAKIGEFKSNINIAAQPGGIVDQAKFYGIREFDGYGKIDYTNIAVSDFYLHGSGIQVEPHGYPSFPPNDVVANEGFYQEYPYTTVITSQPITGCIGPVAARQKTGQFGFSTGNVFPYQQILGRIPDGATVRHAWTQIDVQNLSYQIREVTYDCVNGQSVIVDSKTIIDSKKPTGVSIFACYAKDDPSLQTGVQVYDFSIVGAVASSNAEYVSTHYELLGEATYEITTLLVDIAPLCEAIRQAAKQPRFCGMFISLTEGDYVINSAPAGRGCMKGFCESILESCIVQPYTYFNTELNRNITDIKYFRDWMIGSGGVSVGQILFDIQYPDSVLDEVPINADRFPMF